MKNGKLESQLFIQRISNKSKTMNKYTVNGDGNQTRDLPNVKDAVHGVYTRLCIQKF